MNTSHRATARMVLCFATALLCGMSPCVTPPTFAAEPSADSLAEFLAQPRFKHAHWGLLLVDQKSGETVYELNSVSMLSDNLTTRSSLCSSAICELVKNAVALFPTQLVIPVRLKPYVCSNSATRASVLGFSKNSIDV